METIPSFAGWLRSLFEPASPPAPAPVVADDYPDGFQNVTDPSQPTQGPQIVQVSEQSLVTFSGDIPIPATGLTTVDILSLMGNRCTGFSLVGVTAPIQISINSGGFETVPGPLTIDQAEIKAMQIINNGAACILQLRGV